MTRLRLTFLTIAMGLVAPAACFSQELLTNPGFENSGAGWGSFGNADFNAFFGPNGHASLFMDNPGNFGGVFQTGIAATPGTIYQFDLLDVRIEENAAANLRFGLEYYEANDSTPIAPFDIVPIPLTTTGDGLSFSMTATAPAGAAFVRPIIQFDNVTSTANGQENAFVFDASLTIVPEPTAACLLAIGGATLLARRRVA